MWIYFTFRIYYQIGIYPFNHRNEGYMKVEHYTCFDYTDHRMIHFSSLFIFHHPEPSCVKFEAETRVTQPLPSPTVPRDPFWLLWLLYGRSLPLTECEPVDPTSWFIQQMALQVFPPSLVCLVPLLCFCGVWGRQALWNIHHFLLVPGARPRRPYFP